MSLATLRKDPLNACTRNVYRTGPSSGSFTGSGAMVEGGSCTIGSKELQTGFYELSATASSYASTDYFFPWLRTGVGWVKVPKAAMDGTIVMTGGVNGCTLVVTESGANYYFYHDGDSKYLQASMLTGTEIARVTPKDYDPLGWANKIFQEKLSEASRAGIQPVGDTSYGHFVIAVKKDGRFGFYSTGLMSFNGLTKLPVGLSACIVTFE